MDRHAASDVPIPIDQEGACCAVCLALTTPVAR